MNNDEFDKFLATALRRRAKALQTDEAAIDRVHKRLAGPLPHQHAPLWRWPTVLLDWQFALAWPRMAALAACLALGFGIGISGLDRNVIISAGANNLDFGALVFEPETLTGGRP